MRSEDENAVDEDVPMDEEPNPATKPADDLEQYDLENYDDEDAMPGATDLGHLVFQVLTQFSSDGTLQ